MCHWIRPFINTGLTHHASRRPGAINFPRHASVRLMATTSPRHSQKLQRSVLYSLRQMMEGERYCNIYCCRFFFMLAFLHAVIPLQYRQAVNWFFFSLTPSLSAGSEWEGGAGGDKKQWSFTAVSCVLCTQLTPMCGLTHHRL